MSATNQSPAVMQAEQALAKANAAVDADKAAHSPSCVVVDERRVRRAEIQLSQVADSLPPTPRMLSIIA